MLIVRTSKMEIDAWVELRVMASDRSRERFARVVHLFPKEIDLKTGEEAVKPFFIIIVTPKTDSWLPVPILRVLFVTVQRVENIVDAVAQIFVVVALVRTISESDGR